MIKRMRNSQVPMTMTVYWNWSKYFYKVLRLLGHAPFQESEDNKTLVESVHTWFWTLSAFSLQLTVAIYSYYYRGLITQYWTSYVQVLETLMRLVIAFSIPDFVASWKSVQKMIYYLEEWSVFEVQFKNVTGNKLPSVNPCIVKWHLTLFAVGVIFETCIRQYIFEKHLILWSTMPITFSIYYSVVISTFWAFNCFYISQISKQLNHHLTKALATCSKANTVRAYRLLWLNQQRIIVHLYDAFGASLGIQLFIHYASFTFHCYSIIRGIASGITSRTLRLLSGWSWNFFTFACINEFSNALTIQTGRSTVLEILSKRAQSMSTDVKNEIEFLVDTVYENASPPLLNGCTVLDRNLLVNILVTTLTYLVVLTQFDSSVTEALSTLQTA